MRSRVAIKIEAGQVPVAEADLDVLGVLAENREEFVRKIGQLFTASLAALSEEDGTKMDCGIVLAYMLAAVFSRALELNPVQQFAAAKIGIGMASVVQYIPIQDEPARLM